MSKSASLENATINLNAIREDCKIELEEILDNLPGRICLVLDPELGGLLNHVVPEASRLMKEKGVVYFRQLSPELGQFVGPTGDADDPDHVLYLARATIPHMKLIANQIKQRLELGVSEAFRYQLCLVPHRTLLCEQWLQDEGVLQYLELSEFHLDLIPLDDDLLTLELPHLFRECYVEGDTSSLNIVARSLVKMQALYGYIPNLKAKGSASQLVLQKMMRLRCEEFEPEEVPLEPEIDTLIVLDREIDLATPLLTPLTYEGLIDEFLGITNSFVKLDPELLGTGDEEEQKAAVQPPGVPKKQVPVALNSNDSLFATIRDLNVEQLGPFLQEQAKDIRRRYEEFRSNRKDATINDLHSFVKKIPGLTQTYKYLSQHINIAELIKRTTDSTAFRQRWQAERSLLEGERRTTERLEEMICMEDPHLQVLRLLCLQSITGDGVQKYEFIKREFIQTYGYEYMFTLANLERLGMLKKKESWGDSGGGRWNTLRRTLKLTNDNINVHNPDDISYVSSGYAPLSVRLVEAAVQIGWGNCIEVLKMLSGPTSEIVQREAPEDWASALRRQEKKPVPLDGGGLGAPLVGPKLSKTEVYQQKKTMIVYYVGGVSFMEIAALRYLSKKKEFPYNIIISTTKIIKGDTFLRSIMFDVENNMLRN
eukprot:CAMPEP_0117767068 /NCGR_PEP_ID=MMETSP0947-20121206/21366_1 /TAXON_ID=44440 /ORGANISM="Chattonella subsalsa, Strain CCMP2191" /LENGTH=652 /DNA_ID=CAMNT_0005590601 /DNA_START=6 /DNA_END=1964 /DNA_ORIENTATION=-